jgi:hypothetical protein
VVPDEKSVSCTEFVNRLLPLKTYDESLSVLRRALQQVKVGHTEKLDGFGRLDRFTRSVETQVQPKADFGSILAHERRISSSLGGRTVFDDRKPAKKKSDKQLSLF